MPIPPLFPDPPAGIPAEIVDEVTESIREYCEWHVAPSYEETITIDGQGSHVIMLPSLWVTDVESVTIDGDLLTVTDFRWYRAGYIKLNRSNHGRWCGDDPRSIVIKFTHGYSETPKIFNSVLRRMHRLDDFILGQAATASVSYSLNQNDQGIDKWIGSVLDRHRLPQKA